MARIEDARTIRTKNLIKKAFAETVEQKDIENITVKELAEKAGINRGTFYLHYKDVYDIIEQMKLEMVQSVETSLKTFTNAIDSPIPLLENLYSLVEKDYWIYKAVINARWSGQYTKTVKKMLIEKFKELRKEKAENDPYYVYLLSFIISGTIGMFSDWVLSGEPFPMTEIHKIIENYIQQVLNSEKSPE